MVGKDNQARRRLTSLIEANALTTTPDRQLMGVGIRTTIITHQRTDVDAIHAVQPLVRVPQCTAAAQAPTLEERRIAVL